jgi:hypothetical protein
MRIAFERPRAQATPNVRRAIATPRTIRSRRRLRVRVAIAPRRARHPPATRAARVVTTCTIRAASPQAVRPVIRTSRRPSTDAPSPIARPVIARTARTAPRRRRRARVVMRPQPFPGCTRSRNMLHARRATTRTNPNLAAIAPRAWHVTAIASSMNQRRRAARVAIPSARARPRAPRREREWFAWEAVAPRRLRESCACWDSRRLAQFVNNPWS